MAVVALQTRLHQITMAKGKAATGAKKGGSAGRKGGSAARKGGSAARKVEAPREEEVQSPGEEEFDTPQEEVEQEGAEGAEEVEQGASGSATQPKKSKAANLTKVGLTLNKVTIFFCRRRTLASCSTATRCGAGWWPAGSAGGSSRRPPSTWLLCWSTSPRRSALDQD